MCDRGIERVRARARVCVWWGRAGGRGRAPLQHLGQRRTELAATEARRQLGGAAVRVCACACVIKAASDF